MRLSRGASQEGVVDGVAQEPSTAGVEQSQALPVGALAAACPGNQRLHCLHRKWSLKASVGGAQLIPSAEIHDPSKSNVGLFINIQGAAFTLDVDLA